MPVSFQTLTIARPPLSALRDMERDCGCDLIFQTTLIHYNHGICMHHGDLWHFDTLRSKEMGKLRAERLEGNRTDTDGVCLLDI